MKIGAIIFGFVGLMFFYIIAGTLMGAFTGWVVGLFFGKTILGILASIGITGFKMWQIGAFLGFVGAFFKSNQTKKD